MRLSAKELTTLILDEDRLRSERSDRKLWKSRVTGIDEYGPAPQAIAGPSTTDRPERNRPRKQRPDEEDAEYKLAIEASKYEAEEDAKRRATKSNVAEDDDDLAKAIKLSKEEEELRRRELENQNAASLFDDTPAPAQPQATGYNQGYQQGGGVDWFGNPIQQPQSTGYLNNQYSQPQQTGYQNGFANGFTAQPTGFEQYQQQQPNYPQQQHTMQPMQQQNTIQPMQQQQTAFSNNPYAQQQQPQNASMFQPQSPQPAMPTSGTNNPWATSTQQSANALQPLKTGSNNPFASSFGQPQPSQPPMPQQQKQPSLNTLFENQTSNQFSQPSQPNPIANFQSPQQTQPLQQQKPMNPQHQRLNQLLASGEGQDTFGNTGDLRIPAQHTAPGTFVNSAGGGMDKLRAAQTGNNPFFAQQTTGFQGGFGQQQQFPAQTGPAGGYGAYGQQNNNPFGTRPQPQQQNSLIDL